MEHKDVLPAWIGTTIAVAFAGNSENSLSLALSVTASVMTVLYTAMRMWNLWREWRDADKPRRPTDEDTL